MPTLNAMSQARTSFENLLQILCRLYVTFCSLLGTPGSEHVEIYVSDIIWLCYTAY